MLRLTQWHEIRFHPSGEAVSRMISLGLSSIYTSPTLWASPVRTNLWSAPAGVPTTRALSLVATGADVPRDQFYKSGSKVLPCALAGPLREGAAGHAACFACVVNNCGHMSMLACHQHAVAAL